MNTRRKVEITPELEARLRKMYKVYVRWDSPYSGWYRTMTHHPAGAEYTLDLLEALSVTYTALTLGRTPEDCRSIFQKFMLIIFNIMLGRGEEAERIMKEGEAESEAWSKRVESQLKNN